jgi:anti-sigma-K factor RskA
MDHRTHHELAAGAALDDLDAAERREFEAHVVGCRACRSLSRDLGDVLADLALLAPARTPPLALRGSVLGAVSLAWANPPAVIRRPTSTIPGRPPDRWRLGTIAGLAAAAVFAIVAVGLGLQVRTANDALVASQARLADQAAAMALILDPAHRTASLSAEPVAPIASAVVVYRPGTDEAFVMADHLPATPDGTVYQLWVADAAGVHPLGTFRHDGHGPIVAPFGVDLGTSAAVMITLEPAGGAVGEPGPQVVFGEL